MATAGYVKLHGPTWIAHEMLHSILVMHLSVTTVCFSTGMVLSFSSVKMKCSVMDLKHKLNNLAKINDHPLISIVKPIYD